MPNLCENASFIVTHNSKAPQSPVFRHTFTPKKAIAAAELNITTATVTFGGKTQSVAAGTHTFEI